MSYKEIDMDGDGKITEAEIQRKAELDRLENEDAKQDAQRHMAWFALLGMVFLPAQVILASFIGLDKASTNIADMAPTYFIAVAGIVAAFYGKEAYMKR